MAPAPSAHLAAPSSAPAVFPIAALAAAAPAAATPTTAPWRQRAQLLLSMRKVAAVAKAAVPRLPSAWHGGMGTGVIVTAAAAAAGGLLPYKRQVWPNSLHCLPNEQGLQTASSSTHR